MSRLLTSSGPFLFPCTIEYSLICAAVLFVMWKHIDEEHNYYVEQKRRRKISRVSGCVENSMISALERCLCSSSGDEHDGRGAEQLREPLGPPLLRRLRPRQQRTLHRHPRHGLHHHPPHYQSAKNYILNISNSHTTYFNTITTNTINLPSLQQQPLPPSITISTKTLNK